MDGPVRAIVVDAESSAREQLTRRLTAERDVEVVAQAGAIRAAIELIRQLLDRPTPSVIDQVPMWVDGRVLFLKPRDIGWIDADGDFVRVHLGACEYSTRETMSDFEARLPPTFVRVHRSHIVNRQHIREIQPWVKGDFVIILADGKRITTGRTYRDRVRSLLPPEAARRSRAE
jgi:two-component system LytT family response regulator